MIDVGTKITCTAVVDTASFRPPGLVLTLAVEWGSYYRHPRHRLACSTLPRRRVPRAQ